jgi:hypothetical protein
MRSRGRSGASVGSAPSRVSASGRTPAPRTPGSRSQSRARRGRSRRRRMPATRLRRVAIRVGTPGTGAQCRPLLELASECRSLRHTDSRAHSAAPRTVQHLNRASPRTSCAGALGRSHRVRLELDADRWKSWLRTGLLRLPRGAGKSKDRADSLRIGWGPAAIIGAITSCGLRSSGPCSGARMAPRKRVPAPHAGDLPIPRTYSLLQARW